MSATWMGMSLEFVLAQDITEGHTDFPNKESTPFSRFSLSYLYNHLKQFNTFLGVVCSGEDDVVSDEVLNKKTEEYSHMKP